MKNFETTFTDHIEATRRAAELVAEGVTAKYVGLWDGLYIVEYQANERLPERTMPVTPEPAPVEYQYINRRETMPDGVTRGDGALWPTFAPITSPGWVQIGERPVGFGYHSDGDTVLIFDRTAQPESKMQRGVVFSTNHRPDNRVWVKDNYGAEITAPNELLINFSKGDHLSAAEREAWHQEATGFQDSYYSTFKP